LNKKRNTKYSAIILLLFYAIGIWPTVVFHDHDHGVVAFEQATPCQKNIYYGSDSHHCGHQQHFSQPVEKCFLCDHHSSAFYTFEPPIFTFFKQHCATKYHGFHRSFLSHYTALTFNKGPPQV
jgi:hypothetical protein